MAQRKTLPRLVRSIPGGLEGGETFRCYSLPNRRGEREIERTWHANFVDQFNWIRHSCAASFFVRCFVFRLCFGVHARICCVWPPLRVLVQYSVLGRVVNVCRVPTVYILFMYWLFNFRCTVRMSDEHHPSIVDASVLLYNYTICVVIQFECHS